MSSTSSRAVPEPVPGTPDLSLDAALADEGSGAATAGAGGRRGRGVLQNGSWNTLAQLAPIVVNIGMTPYVIAGIGVERFGLYILLMTVADFLATFDGGIYRSAERFFALHAGRRDEPAAARLLVTLVVAVLTLGSVMAAVLSLTAGAFLDLFHVAPQLRPDGLFLLHSLAVIIGLGVLRGLFAASLNGRQHFKATSVVTLMQYAVYTVGVVVALRAGHGLKGIALALVAQLLSSLLLLGAVVLRSLPVRSSQLMTRPERREFWLFASRTQVVGLSDLITLQSQSLIVGRALDVTRVGLFSSGANFARQLRRLPLNAIGPAGAVLASTFGAHGTAATTMEFRRLQRLWVQAVTGWMVVAAGAAWFGVTAWLGPGFGLSGTVAVVLLVGFLLQLWTSMLTVYCQSIGHPEIEARSSLVTLLLGLGLTIALVVPYGVLGVVVGSAAAQVLGGLYLLRLVRARLGTGVPNFLAEVPWAAAGLAAAVTVGVELLARDLVPQGPFGLITSGALAGPGVLAFALTVLGPHGLLDGVRRRGRRPADVAPERAPAPFVDCG